MKETERACEPLDTMARAAAQACGATAAVVALHDGEGMVCASHPGFATPEEALAVAGEGNEAPGDWRFRAACPLVTPDGHTIGVLAVADHAARGAVEVPPALETLAGQVVAELQHIDDSERLKKLARKYHRTRKALCEANEHLQCFLDGRNDLVVAVDAAGRFLQVNEAFSKLLGYSEADLAGRTLWDLVALAHRPAVPCGGPLGPGRGRNLSTGPCFAVWFLTRPALALPPPARDRSSGRPPSGRARFAVTPRK